MINTHPTDEAGFPVTLRATTAASGIDCLSHQREIEIESCAFAGAALHANLAGVLLNDSVTYRQAQSRALGLPFTDALGGEEWVVDPMNVFLRNAASSVGNHD